MLHIPPLFDKLLSLSGGFSEALGSYSFEQGFYGELATLGSLDHNGRDDLLNSKLIILWATDPANTVANTPTSWFLIQARDKGAKIVCIDTRYTDTAAMLAHQWIPIIPGTDCAMMIAIAYVMIKENLQDQRFLDAYTVGFDKFKEYVIGKEDGVPKTPAWAEAITSVPASTIERFAREFAATKPAALLTGISAVRTALGEQYQRAAITLAAMTGNIGKSGGGTGGRSWTIMSMLPPLKTGWYMTDIENPLMKGRPIPKNFLPRRPDYFLGAGSVWQAKMADALIHGKAGGFSADYKLLFIVNHNFLNQCVNINKTVEAMKKLEFIVTVEQFMTPTAKWSDVVLPACTFLERNDLVNKEGAIFFGCQNKAIEPVGESKSQFDIVKGLAAKLGISEFENVTEEGLLRQIANGSDITDYDAFREKVIHRVDAYGRPYIGFKKQIEDPEHNPFPTPSGKIEIYSQQLADFNDPLMPPIPKYIETWESRNDPLAKKYPLQLLTTHFRRRAHSQFETIPWLRETQIQGIQMNPADALARDIDDGDMVRVFNDRGATMLPAIITRRIMRGVVAIPQGAWYDPDENGVDRAGSSNVLTKDEISPGGGYITNTCLVQVEKA
jgi:anaerobic dimethyl sulfoxide reductase subunit A